MKARLMRAGFFPFGKRMLETLDQELPIDSPLGRAVVEELRTGQMMKQVREREAMAAVQKERGNRFRKGDMCPTMMIPPTSYHYWGQRLGYECWEDKQFVREFLRDNEVCRVKTRPVNTMVGWTAAVDYGQRRKQQANMVNGIFIR